MEVAELRTPPSHCQSRGLTTRVWWVALLICALISVRGASGQAVGNIAGYVKDTSGASIPGVVVTATMREQKTSRTTQTDSEGFYSFVGLLPGHYDVSFEAKGFQTLVRSGLELTVGQDVRVDAALTVGAVQTRVEVGAAAPLVDTVSSTLSGLIDDRRVVDLPLNGRNIMSLAALLPGVTNVSHGGRQALPRPWAMPAEVLKWM